SSGTHRPAGSKLPFEPPQAAERPILTAVGPITDWRRRCRMAAKTMFARVLFPMLLMTLLAGCGGVPMSQFRAAQYQTLMTHRQLVQTNQMANQIAAEKQQLEQMAAQLQGSLESATRGLPTVERR